MNLQLDEGYGQDQCAADLEMILPLNGLHVGQLTLAELDAFSRLCRAEMADRDYACVSGFMGLPHVRVFVA